MTDIRLFSSLTNEAVKREERELNGKIFYVFPVVAIREGVLNGLYIPKEVLSVSAPGWNFSPVTIGHPKIGSTYVSARVPEIISTLTVGYFFNVEFDRDANSLIGEVWIDSSNVSGLSLVDQLIDDNKRFDVSVGFFSVDEFSSGIFDGNKYDVMAKVIIPDHLAILKGGERGACSWEDGCGIPRVNNMNEINVNVLRRARTPSFEGTETISWASVDKTFEAYVAGYYKHSGAEKPENVPARVQDAPAAMKQWIASKTLIGSSTAETIDDLIAFPVVNPNTNKLNAGALRNAIARAPQANIPVETQESIQRVARNLLDRHFTNVESAKDFGFVDFLAKLFSLSKRDCSCQYDKIYVEEDNDEGNGEVLVMNDKVNKLIELGCFEKDDIEILNKLNDAALDKLIAAFENSNKSDEVKTEVEAEPVEEEIKSQEQVVSKEAEEEVPVTEEHEVVLENVEVKDETPKVNSMDEAIDLIPDPWKSEVASAVAFVNEYKKKLIANIAKHSDLTEGEMKDFSVDKLEKLSKAIKADSDYSGVVMRRVPKIKSNDKDGYKPPSVLL